MGRWPFTISLTRLGDTSMSAASCAWIAFCKAQLADGLVYLDGLAVRIACALPYVKTHLRHIRQGETHIVSLGVGL